MNLAFTTKDEICVCFKKGFYVGDCIQVDLDLFDLEGDGATCDKFFASLRSLLEEDDLLVQQDYEGCTFIKKQADIDEVKAFPENDVVQEKMGPVPVELLAKYDPNQKKEQTSSVRRNLKGVNCGKIGNCFDCAMNFIDCYWERVTSSCEEYDSSEFGYENLENF